MPPLQWIWTPAKHAPNDDRPQMLEFSQAELARLVEKFCALAQTFAGGLEGRSVASPKPRTEASKHDRERRITGWPLWVKAV